MKRAADIVVGIVVTVGGSFALATDTTIDPVGLLYVGLAYAGAIAITVVVVIAGLWAVDRMLRMRGGRCGR